MPNPKFPTDDPNRIAVLQSGLSQPTWHVSLSARVTKPTDGTLTGGLAPAMAVWVYPCSDVRKIPGTHCVRALPVCIGDGITMASVWLHNLTFEGQVAPATAPPAILMDFRAADSAISETIASLVAEPEAMSDKGLLVGANGLPLCNQVEVWARLGPDAPDGMVVRVNMSIRIGAGGSGPLQITYGELVTSGLLVPGTVLGV